MASFGNFISKYVNLLQMGFVLLPLLMSHTQARIGYFWHISDLHLDTIYSTQGDVLRSCWHIERQSPSSATRPPGRFGDYLCDSPWSLIESAAKAMKSRQGDNVEFVLWTGDGLSHSAHPMFETKKLEILRNITELLGRTFSSQFVFPVLGHEDGTTTNFRRMGELWRHWLPSEALHTFEKGGYYSIEQTKSRLRIIALNTNFMRHDPKYSQSHLAAVRQRTPPNSNGGGGSIGSGGNGPETPEYKNYYYHHGASVHQHHGHASDWSSSSSSSSSSQLGYGYSSHHRGIGAIPGVSVGQVGVGGLGDTTSGGRVSALSEYENQDTEKQWIWLEDVLSKSKNNKETVYIVGHIPPGSDERHIGLQQNGHTTFTESNNKRYLDLVRKYSSIIQGQFFGHLHSDSFRIIYDDKGKPVSWMMISPSVTPRKMSVGSNNPAMRLYKFDTDSGQVLDYTQYYMDLQLANTLGEPNWVPEYNLTHYYALSDISAISLHNFVDRFTGNDDSWFAKYYRANTVRYVTDPCEGVCMLNHYCAITRLDYKEFRQCLEKEQSALGSHAAPSVSASAPYTPLVLAAALIVCGWHRVTAILTYLLASLYAVSQRLQMLQLRRRQPIQFAAAALLKLKTLVDCILSMLKKCCDCSRMTTTTTTTTPETTTAAASTTTTTIDDNCMQLRSMTTETLSPHAAKNFRLAVIPFGNEVAFESAIFNTATISHCYCTTQAAAALAVHEKHFCLDAASDCDDKRGATPTQMEEEAHETPFNIRRASLQPNLNLISHQWRRRRDFLLYFAQCQILSFYVILRLASFFILSVLPSLKLNDAAALNRAVIAAMHQQQKQKQPPTLRFKQHLCLLAH